MARNFSRPGAPLFSDNSNTVIVSRINQNGNDRVRSQQRSRSRDSTRVTPERSASYNKPPPVTQYGINSGTFPQYPKRAASPAGFSTRSQSSSRRTSFVTAPEPARSRDSSPAAMTHVTRLTLPKQIFPVPASQPPMNRMLRRKALSTPPGSTPAIQREYTSTIRSVSLKGADKAPWTLVYLLEARNDVGHPLGFTRIYNDRTTVDKHIRFKGAKVVYKFEKEQKQWVGLKGANMESFTEVTPLIITPPRTLLRWRNSSPFSGLLNSSMLGQRWAKHSRISASYFKKPHSKEMAGAANLRGERV